MTKKTNKATSTYEQFIKDKKQKTLLDKEYKELLISELMLAAMQRDQLSVRRLAKEIGISPTIIQEMKTGKRTNITLTTFTKVLDALGYQIAISPKYK